MGFLAREHMRRARVPSGRVVVQDGPDADLIGAHNALADVAAAERARAPKVFKKVDRIKSKPGRPPQHITPFVCSRNLPECKWCGDSFIPSRSTGRHCSVECWREHRRFDKRRKQMSDKTKLEKTAETLEEVAGFADYLRVLALGSNDTAKADRLEEQAGDLRAFAGIYTAAAANSE